MEGCYCGRLLVWRAAICGGLLFVEGCYLQRAAIVEGCYLWKAAICGGLLFVDFSFLWKIRVNEISKANLNSCNKRNMSGLFGTRLIHFHLCANSPLLPW